MCVSMRCFTRQTEEAQARVIQKETGGIAQRQLAWGIMNWHSILSAAKLLGTAALIVGIIAIVIFGQILQTRHRLTKYKNSGRFMDLLRIFSRY